MVVRICAKSYFIDIFSNYNSPGTWQDCQNVQTESTVRTAQCTQFLILRKLVEVILAASISLFALSELILTIVKIHRRFSLPFVIAIQLFIFLSEGCKCFYEIWHNLLEYFFLLFSALSFLTIFYYVGSNVVQDKAPRVLVHVTYYVFTLTFVALCTERCIFYEKNKNSHMRLHCTRTIWLRNRKMVYYSGCYYLSDFYFPVCHFLDEAQKIE